MTGNPPTEDAHDRLIRLLDKRGVPYRLIDLLKGEPKL
jgi:hypothetical protein